MRHSLRLRLLLILVAVPVAALAFVAIAARLSSDSNLDSRLQFEILPVPSQPGIDDNEVPGFRTEIDLQTASQPVTFDTGTGQVYTVQAGRGFLEAYEEDREAANAAINRQVTFAAVAVTAASLVVAVWLSSRIVRPVEQLTEAARRLESGDLSRRVEVGSIDEIGTLGSAFNAMAASIERNQDLRRQMTSDIAHELRTPLNNISGYLDAIADGVVAPRPEVIGSLQEEAGLLVRLVGDLEQLSLADAGRQVLLKERVELADVVERAVALVMPRARAGGITIQVQSRPCPPVEGDATRLGQVVRNLLENAITHTPPDGHIVVALEPQHGAVLLKVIDSGAGVSAEHLPFIFERFYRADASRTRATGGAGLGLAIVKQLVEAHGGSVTVHNLTGSGACFTVELPVAAAVPSAFGLTPGRRLASSS